MTHDDQPLMPEPTEESPVAEAAFTQSDCSKRVWVLQTLSDDETQSPGEDLPAGLRFHLNRCPSCRAIAAQVARTTTTLAQAGHAAMLPASLAQKANDRLTVALHEGAKTTGREDIAAGLDYTDRHAAAAAPEHEADQPMLSLKRWLTTPWQSAAAAVIVLAAIAAWQFYPREQQDAATNNSQSTQGSYTVKNIEGGNSGPSPGGRQALPGGGDPVTRLAERPPRRQYSDPVDAALTDREGSVQPAFVLPDPRERGVNLRIDTALGFGFIKPNARPEQP